MQGATWTSLVWFFAVLAAIPLVLWLFKRSALGQAMGGTGGGRAGTPRTVAVLALSPQHRLVTVEVGEGEERVWLVVGMSPQGLRTLHTMSPGADPGPAAPTSQAAAFNQLLGRMRQGGSGDARR